MSDFICDCNCTYQKENECQLGLLGLNGESFMPGFCPRLHKKKNIRLESQL